MAHWIIRSEATEYPDGTQETISNIVFVDSEGNETRTMFDIFDDKYEKLLPQGIELTRDEIGTIKVLEGVYGIHAAIDVVTAFRFKNKEDIADAKFMLAPGIQEAQETLEHVDSQDIKALLDGAGISINKYAAQIHAPVRTIRDKMNIHKTQSQLSFAEKYVANVLCYQAMK